MMRIFLFLVLIVSFFMGGFEGARWLKSHRFWQKDDPTLRLDTSFLPTMYPLENLPFAIVIIGRNNGAWAEKTLQSAFSQNYPNYRIFYIDDASDDGSFELARDLIEASHKSSQVTLIQNETNQGFLLSLSQAIESCFEKEIVVILHGEDRLAHEWVLQRLNQYYANPDLWITYGQYLYDHTYQFGNCGSMADEAPRISPFFASHLKTFYAYLFKKVGKEDLFFKGQGIGAEMALMIPMLEMAKGHAGYIPDVLYIATKQNENLEQLRRLEAQIRSLTPYAPLTALFHEVD